MISSPRRQRKRTGEPDPTLITFWLALLRVITGVAPLAATIQIGAVDVPWTVTLK